MNDKLNGIIPWFAANPVAANLFMVLIITLGVLQMGSLRKEAFPSLEPNNLTVSVSYDSGSAKQSEEGVAIKIEDQLENVIGIKSITSNATSSGATVNIEKQTDYDLDVLLRDVKTQVDAISNFPEDADKPVIEKAQREEHALFLQLYGDADRSTLQQLADELKADLLAHDNINRVSISGRLDPMISIEIDEGRLQAYGLSLSDIESAINKGSSTTRTAVLRTEDLYLQLKASQQAYLKEAFAAISLLTLEDGSVIRLGDVAIIRDTYEEDAPVLSRFNGHSSIALQVITTGQDDISKTVAAAREVLETWKMGGNLPQGIQLADWYDRSTMIVERLQLLAKNALTGFAIVFLILALFLNLTVAFWVAMGLPFIFFGTLFFMGDSFTGLSLNEFTTFGFIMALGIVVDDAVVVGESVFTTRSREGDTLNNTIKGTLRVAVPTLFGVFTTIAAFYAISKTSGHLGQLYSQFATVVAICLILSIIESKLILPSHLSHLNTTPRKSNNPLRWCWQQIQRGSDMVLTWVNEICYRRLISLAVTYRYAVVTLFAVCFVLVISMPFTGAVRLSFFPEITGDTVRAELTMKQDAGYGQTHAALMRLERLAGQADQQLCKTASNPKHTLQHVLNPADHAPNSTGDFSPDMGGKPDMKFNSNQLQSNGEQSPFNDDNDDQVQSTGEIRSGIANLQILSASDQSGSIKVELEKDAPYDIRQFTKIWRELAGLPEGARTLSVQSRPGMVDALRIELRANDSALLTAAGQALKQELAAIPAVSGIEDNLEPGQPQLHLELTRQGYSLGLTMDMLAQQVMQAFSGQVVQRFQREIDEVEVKVRYPENARQSIGDVMSANIRTSDGIVLPLSDVAKVTSGYTQDTITRIDGKRAVTISADVDKDRVSSTELVTRLERQVVPKLMRQYPGLDVHFSGEAEEQAETQSSMIQMFLLALLIIYFLLAVPLKSYIQPVLIMTAIPFGIVGAILGHWATHLSLGILSLNGIIALSGVVVNDSLLLVSTFNDLMKEPGMEFKTAVSRAGRNRLRAVLLTSLTTVAGLLPLLSETSMQARFLIPAAVSLAYGIMFATLITLILIPVLLVIQHDIMEWLRYPGRLLKAFT